MYINNLEQLKSFFIFTVIGIIIGILFDIFRISRKIFKTSDILTYIEDILFWLISGLIILFSIFLFNNGELRLYIFIGISIGILIYMLSISRYFIKINILIINYLKLIILKILHIIFKPLKFIFSIIKMILFKPISFIFINFKKIIKKNIICFQKYKKTDKKLDKKEGI